MRAPELRAKIEAAGAERVGEMGLRTVYKLPDGGLVSAPSGDVSVASSEILSLAGVLRQLGHPEDELEEEDLLADEIAAELELLDQLAAPPAPEPAPAKPAKKKRARKTDAPPDIASEPEAQDAPAADKRAENPAPPEPVTRTPQQHRLALKRKVRMFYDLQRLRMQAAGRTLARPTKPGEEERVEIFLHEVDLAILETRAKDLRRVEREALRDVEAHLQALPFFVQVLSDKTLYKGIGPTMAGVIMAEFDIHRSDTVSKMWAFAGLHTEPAERCRHCFTLVDAESFKHIGKTPKACMEAGREYVVLEADRLKSGKSPRPKKGEKLPYNAWLRTKLVGVLGAVLLKVGSPWRKTYDDYKHRLESKGWGKNPGHRHQASIRYMVKMLLLDIHRRWRLHEGLVLRPPYSEEKLGMAPHGGHQAA
jgi:hypothetical protein